MKFMSVLMFCFVVGLSVSKCLACPPGWVSSGADSCYQFNEDGKTWDDARAECKKDGGDLAIVSTLAKAANLRSIRETLGNQKNYYWVGAYKSKRLSTVFIWIGGGRFSESLWYAGEPNDLDGWMGTWQCVDMGSAEQEMKMCDWDCFASLGYICEK